MQSIWTGLETATVTDRGNFFGEGSFDVQIERTIVKASEKTRGETLFIVETTVLTTTNQKNPQGSAGSWIVKMSLQNAPGNIKGYILAALGLDHREDAERIEREIRPIITQIMDRVVSISNPLAGRWIHLDTNIGRVNKGKPNEGDFTFHNWSPFDYQAAGMQAPDPGQLVQQIMSLPIAPYGAPQGYGAPRSPWPATQNAAPPPSYIGGQTPPNMYGNGAPGGWGPHAPPQAPQAPPPPPPGPPAQLSPDGLWKLVNNQWVPNR